MNLHNRSAAACIAAALIISPLHAQKPSHITTPQEALGFNVGDDYQIANYTQLEVWWKKLATRRSH